MRMKRKHWLGIVWLLILCLLAGCGGAAVPPEAGAASLPGLTAPAETDDAPTAAARSTEAAATAPQKTEQTGTAPWETKQTETEMKTEAYTEAREFTEVPAAEPDPAAARLAEMRPEEKLAQLFVVTPEALVGASDYVTAAGEAFGAAYREIPVGGFLLMGGNLKDPEQTRALLRDLQAMSQARLGLPLFLCVDEEGGRVARISGRTAFGIDALPPMAELGRAGDPEQARALGRRMGVYLRELGFNVDFAPDADVLTNPENRVIGNRSFGSDGTLVAQLAGALAEGLLEEGVLPCYKHFPGHGGTAEDSHKGFAVLHRDREALLGGEELKPFADGARRGVPMMMTGHIAVPEFSGDELPASLSPALIGLLRGPEVGYDGLLITDALSMGAITQRYGPGEAAVLALEAGNDLLLVTAHLEEARQAVLEAVENGRISMERIDESVLRILKAKEALP